jgi:hypothetical protein
MGRSGNCFAPAAVQRRRYGDRVGEWGLGNRVVRTAIFSIAALFGGIIAAVCWFIWTQSHSIDFISFWAAGRMLLEGAGAAIYDIDTHRAVERSAVATVGLMPFPYPPPFALIVAPFGALSYGAAFSAWVAATIALYLVAARRWMPPLLALAQPSVLVNGFIGQAAFLTSATFMAGTRLLASRPMLGGALLGALVIKPQLGVLLPLALVAGRQWRAFAGAALSSVALLLAPLPVVGFAGYSAFLKLASTFAGYVTAGRWPWQELASVYALLSYFAVPRIIGFSVHLAVAVAAAVLVWRAWRGDRPGKVATLAAATLLIPPYLLTYDGILLALPVAFLLIEGRRPYFALVVWLLSLLSVGAVFRFYDAPNVLPLAAILALLAIERVNISSATRREASTLPQPS